MRAAPPVQMNVGRSAAWALGVAVLRGGALATLLGWMAWHAGLASLPVRLAIAALALAIGVASARSLMRAPQGLLAWDGASWRLDGAPGGPERVLDAGGWLLLRWHGEDGRVHWLPLVPGRCGASAHLARAALLAHGLGPARAKGKALWRHG
jgi:hypothetical protein